jgi:hypothetical protein
MQLQKQDFVAAERI